MTFNPGIPRDLKEKKTNRPPPAPNLLAIFESETTEGGKLLLYFERFSATPCTTFYLSIVYAPFRMDAYG
jgi:hypothetical protein